MTSCATGGRYGRPERIDRHDRRWLPVVAAVAVRPSLWPTALVQVGRLARPGWWRRWPPLPVPDPAWLAFRLQTAYGDPAHIPEANDVVAWLKWCRSWERLR